MWEIYPFMRLVRAIFRHFLSIKKRESPGGLSLHIA